jgi:hypothetical protein
MENHSFFARPPLDFSSAFFAEFGSKGLSFKFYIFIEKLT